MRWIVLIPVVFLLSSCEALRDWVATQPAPSDPVPPTGGQLPQVGGGDVLDVVVTVLSMLGLLPAARLVGASRPIIVAALRALFPKKADPKPADEPPATAQ